MIQEAYCSYEVSKLLEEKGFYGQCHNFVEIQDTSNCGKWSKKSEKTLSIPTQQMAMRWLREIHGLFIDIGIDDLEWNFAIYNIKDRDENLDPIMLTPGSYAGYRTYDIVIEAAIKYCLENLIK